MYCVSRSSVEKPDLLPKVAILSPSAPPISVGGIATSHYALYLGLKSRGIPTRFYTFADFGANRFQTDSDPDLFRAGRPLLFAKGIQFFGKLWFLLRERSTRFRIYQTGDVWKARAGARRIAKRMRDWKPDIVVFPDQASPACWLEKLPGQRWIQVSHHQALRFVHQPEIGEHSLRDALSALRFEREQVSRSDLCVAPSQYMKGVFQSFVSTSVPVEVIPNLVEEGSSIPNKAVGTYTRVFIPSAGSRFKGSEIVPEIISAVDRAYRESAPKKELEFFLSGALSAAQREKIDRVAPGMRIIAPGHLSHREVLENLACASVCVSPTWIENQSMALLEAKSLGVPFVTFDVGGNRELLGAQDRVVSRGDIGALARATLETLRDPRAGANEERWNSTSHNSRALDRWIQILMKFSKTA
jgi:glycosyltransferase involved in cell wall biosynthesis